MRYAIVEDGIIINMIELNPMNADDFPNAVYADEWSITIGDTYNAEEEVFYHEDRRILSEREIAMQLRNALEVLTGDLNIVNSII